MNARLRSFFWLFLLPAIAFANGCASFTNPTAYEGIPVNRLPDEVLGRPRTELQPIPLTMLRQRDPDEYRVDKGDVLGIVADQVLGTNAAAGIPVQYNPNPNASRQAVLGYPVPVQEDGTIVLPQLPPLYVRGKTLPEIQKYIVGMITGQLPGAKEIVVPGQERVLVDLVQPRRFQVLVVREDAGGASASSGVGGTVLGVSRRGAGYNIFLEAYKNDVLRALNVTGGLPGVDAKNEVIIRRGNYDPNEPDKGFVRIPMRARPDEPLTFTEQDIILNDGDTVYIEARDTESYYTGGLLGGAQIPLPRDYDLRVTDAIAQIRGPLFNGGFSQTAFTSQSVSSGLGRPNPSLVSVVRRTPNNKVITIRVDLNRAIRDLRENIIIMPGDTVILQERPGEALARYLSEQIRITTTYIPINSSRANQTIVGSQP